MSQLLRIDAGVRPESLSRELTDHFAKNWQVSTGGTVVHRDLALTPVPHVTATVGDHFVYQTDRGLQGKAQEVAFAEDLVSELRSADALLVGLPMHNFSIPSVLKAWIDHVVWPGLTFAPDGGGMLSIPAVVICTRGGGYGPGSPRDGWNFQEPYLRKVLSFIGIDDVEFVSVEFTMFTGEDSPRPDLGQLGVDSLTRAWTRLGEFPYRKFGMAAPSPVLIRD